MSWRSFAIRTRRWWPSTRGWPPSSREIRQPKDNAERLATRPTGLRQGAARDGRPALGRGPRGRPEARRRPPGPAPLQRRLRRRAGRLAARARTTPRPTTPPGPSSAARPSTGSRPSWPPGKRVSMIGGPGNKELVAKTLDPLEARRRPRRHPRREGTGQAARGGASRVQAVMGNEVQRLTRCAAADSPMHSQSRPAERAVQFQGYRGKSKHPDEW